MKKPVEKFRLSKEQLAFQKQYKKLSQVAKVLRGEMDVTMRKGQTLGQMMQEVNGQMLQMLEAAPKQPTNDLVGQENEQVQAQA
ncbi:MAG: hypothetical protein WC083_04910 [Candidatus Methanomethylophilaceae archaeon]